MRIGGGLRDAVTGRIANFGRSEFGQKICNPTLDKDIEVISHLRTVQARLACHATCANESILKSELHRLIDPLDGGPIFGLDHLPVHDEAQWTENVVLDRGNVQSDIPGMRGIGH